MKKTRIRTYISELDDRMQGGIPEGAIVLVEGKAGSMKSSLAYSILYNNGHKAGKKSIYLTFEQKGDSLLHHMENLGFDTKNMKDLIVLDLGQVRDITTSGTDEDFDWMMATIRSIEHLKKNFGCEILVIDSLNALYAMSDMTNPRLRLFQFTEGLRSLEMTTFLITEIQKEGLVGIFGSESYLADGIIHLDTVKEGKNIGIYIGVKKMRATNHTRAYYPLLVSDGEFGIVTK